MNPLDIRNRQSTLRELGNTTYDLVVIGGGITGAGILREASLRGLSVALLEAEDFASGTSSKSTKLVHGGIRYLEMGQIHVVREAARERKRVHQLAPHLAEPQWLMLPAGNWFEYLKYRIGVSVYEWLGQVDRAELHTNVTGRKLYEREPLLSRQRYTKACFYREYLTDDARLVIANIRAGIAAGGIALNKLKVTAVVKDADKVSGVKATCSMTGDEVVISCKGVINAAGPWVESICDLDGLPSEKSLVLSKGIHVVVPFDRLPINQMSLLVAKDGRPVFAIPRGDVVYIGTTDSKYEQPANVWPEVNKAEIEYLFKPIKDYFDVELTMADCLSTWAGLRPLIAERGKSTTEISRKDEVWVSQSGLITIAGGKLTGYRKMAEEATDKAIEVLGLSAARSSPELPLPGGDFTGSIDQQVEKLADHFNLDHAVARRLVRLYGSEVETLLGNDASAVIAGARMRNSEIRWAIEKEGATNLEDVIYRRTRAALYVPEEVLDVLPAVSQTMAEMLGWSEQQRLQQVSAVKRRFSLDSFAS